MTISRRLGWAPGAAAMAMLLLAASAVCAAEPSPASVQRGRKLAVQVCAACHAVERGGKSPLKDAPRFSALLETFPGRNLEEILADGLMTPHQPMPMFLASDQNRDDLLAYLYSIQERREARLDWPRR